MNPDDLRDLADEMKLTWDGDNSQYMLHFLIPNLALSDYDKAVLTWAYGGEALGKKEKKSYEKDSNGESSVRDRFLNGKCKNPAGVSHDYINRVPHHMTPDGHIWTASESNAFYLRVKKALGAGFRHRWRRYLALQFTAWLPLALKGWWRPAPHR